MPPVALPLVPAFRISDFSYLSPSKRDQIPIKLRYVLLRRSLSPQRKSRQITNVGSGTGHGRWRSEQMSQLLERLLPGFLQILAMLLLVGGFYLPLLLFLGGQDPL